jgi:hypothetical protein
LSPFRQPVNSPFSLAAEITIYTQKSALIISYYTALYPAITAGQNPTKTKVINYFKFNQLDIFQSQLSVELISKKDQSLARGNLSLNVNDTGTKLDTPDMYIYTTRIATTNILQKH